MFDPPEMVKWAQIPYNENESREHAEVAIETARESIVLLKNQNNVLPLKKDIRTLAVIGPNADDAEVMLGNYNGQPSHPVTPLAGIRAKVGTTTRVIYARGTDIAPGMPSFEAIPTSALFTTNDRSGKPGLKAEYFATSNFNGRALCGASLRDGRNAQGREGASVEPEAAVHARGCQRGLRLAGWRAA